MKFYIIIILPGLSSEAMFLRYELEGYLGTLLYLPELPRGAFTTYETVRVLSDARVFKAKRSAETQPIFCPIIIKHIGTTLSSHQVSRLQSAPSNNAMNQILL